MAREVAVHLNYREFVIRGSIAQRYVFYSHRIPFNAIMMFLYTRLSNIHSKPTTQEVYSQLGM